MNLPNWEWEVIVGFVTVLAFLWRLNRDMRSLDDKVSSLGERVARIEGALFYRLDLPKKKKKE